jgi:biotin carboxyl carrier protein
MEDVGSMKYRLKIGEETTGLEIVPSENSPTAQAIIDDKKWQVSFSSISDNHLHLDVDGVAVQAYLAQGNDGKHIFINGQVFNISEVDLQAHRSVHRKKQEDTPGEVTPPMPSVVVRILVEEGDWVIKGQGLIVVSAMKMETTLKAPVEGKVLKIKTALQAKVMPGDRLVEIKEGIKDE